MTLGRVLYILGVVLIVWAIISGFRFYFSFSDLGYSYGNSYSFKFGTMLVGIMLVYFGKRAQE